MDKFIYSTDGSHQLVTFDVAEHFLQKRDWFDCPKKRDVAIAKAAKKKAKSEEIEKQENT